MAEVSTPGDDDFGLFFSDLFISTSCIFFWGTRIIKEVMELEHGIVLLLFCVSKCHIFTRSLEGFRSYGFMLFAGTFQGKRPLVDDVVAFSLALLLCMAFFSLEEEPGREE